MSQNKSEKKLCAAYKYNSKYLKKKLGKSDIHWNINDNNYKLWQWTNAIIYNLIIL